MSGPDDAPHQRHVGGRGAAWTETGRRLHEVCARSLGQRACRHLLVVRQQRRFDDDLAEGSGLAGQRRYAFHVALREPRLAGLQRTDVHDHVDLAGSVEQGPAGFVLLGIRRGRSEWKADDRAHRHATSLYEAGAQRHPGRIDAHGGELVLGGFAAEGLDLVARSIWPE